jgi:hypothetical protein
MNSVEISTTFENGKNDGRELYEVVAVLKKVGLALVVGLAILCVGLALAMLEKGFAAFMLSITISAILLFILYAVVIVGTNTAQVFVHLLNSNLALLSIAIDKLESVGSEKISMPQAQAKNEEKKVIFIDQNFLIESLNDAKQYCQQSGYTLSSDGDKFTLKANRLTHFFYSEKEVISWCISDFAKTKPTPQQPS